MMWVGQNFPKDFDNHIRIDQARRYSSKILEKVGKHSKTRRMCEHVWACVFDMCVWQFDIVKNKLMSVFNASVLLLTMNFVITPRGSTATLTMLWRNSWSITGQTHEKLTSICYFSLKCRMETEKYTVW